MTISWSSNCAGFGAVHYGLTATQLNGLIQDKNFVQNHMVVLTNLAQGRTYFYFVATLNTAGIITAQSVTLSFTTLINTPLPTATSTATATPTDTPTDTSTPTFTSTPTDTATPTLTATASLTPTVTSTPTTCSITAGPFVQAGSTSVTISWSSNCAGFGAVHYGLTATQLNGLIQDKNFVQNHTVVLTNLAQGRTYFYFVATLNTAGIITAQSVTLSFTTLINTPLPTATSTATATPTDTPTDTSTPTFTSTPTDTPSFTVVPSTDTPTSTPTG